MKLEIMTEGILGDMFKNFITDLKANVQDKHGARKIYPKVIAAAEAVTVPLLSSHPDAIDWWDRLFNTFKVPQGYKQGVLKKLVTAIQPHIPTVEDDMEELAMQQMRRQERLQDQNQRRRRTNRRDQFDENTAFDRYRKKQTGYKNAATPFDFKNFDSGKNRFLDLLLGNKKTIKAYITRGRNRHVAILACNMLMELMKTPIPGTPRGAPGIETKKFTMRDGESTDTPRPPKKGVAGRLTQREWRPSPGDIKPIS